VFGGEAERAETAAALESAKGKLRSAVGRGIGIRLTPTLEFIPDALPEGAAHLEAAPADTLAFTVFPKDVWRQVWSTNPLSIEPRDPPAHRRRRDLPASPSPA